MLRFLFVLLAFISGAAALSHELLWTRRLIDLLGATESVTGRVLGLFFLGLSLGGWLATRWSRSTGNSAVRLGIAELSIALLSLPAIFLPVWADGVVSAIGTDVLVSWQGHLIKALLVAAVVLPPAIAMGATMPMFMRIMTDLGGSLNRSGIWVYAVNMLGGVFGLWLVSILLLERFGVGSSMLCAAAFNVVIALTAFAVSPKCVPRSSIDEQTGDPVDKKTPGLASTAIKNASESNLSRRHVFLMAFLSGAIVLACEVLILRLLALVAPSSLQTTSALLANVILFLAVGSIVVALLNRLGVSSQTQLIIGAVGAALFCALCPLILYEVTNDLISVRYLVARNRQVIGSIGQYWWLMCLIVAWSSGGAMIFFGLMFPSIMSLHARHDPAGRSVGLLLAINGVGGLLGAELANQILIFQIGIYPGFAILAFITAAIAIGGCLLTGKKIAAIGVVSAMVVAGLFCSEGYQKLRYLSPHAKKQFDIKHTTFGREGVMMVVETPSGSRSILMNNQYILGSSGTEVEATERRQLLLPWTLHPESKSVCCLGFATGISASGLESLESPPQVTSIELSAKVLEVARSFFTEQNQGFFRRAENQVLVEDARTFMACAKEDYDLIVADLFRPHGVGESRLFSLEHFKNVRRALRPHGLFCQWLPAHQLNQAQFKTIAHTFSNVFPNTLIVTGGVSTSTPMIGLCARKEGTVWETEDLVEKIAKFRTQKDVKDIWAHNPQLFVVGVMKQDAVSSAPLNTLDNALLEINAGEFWVTRDLRPDRSPDDLKNGFLSKQNWPKFMKWLHENTTPVLDPIHRKQYLDALK